jgi:hypothetical protein
MQLLQGRNQSVLLQIKVRELSPLSIMCYYGYLVPVEDIGPTDSMCLSRDWREKPDLSNGCIRR